MPASKPEANIPTEDREILEELQSRWDYARDQWAPIFEQGHQNIRYLTGHTWEDADLRGRNGRLSLEFDQLNQYLNLLINSVRQQQRAIKITPEGNGANDKTAQVRADRIRQIEYLSHAQEAYVSAFAGAAERGYGYCQIEAEWEPKGFKKQLRIRPMPNPDQWVPDPDATSITGADWQYGFYTFDMSREEFKRDYPDALIRDYADMSDETQGRMGDWQSVDRVQVAKYWRVTMTQKKLLRLENPQQPGQFVDVLEEARKPAQQGWKVVQDRMADVPVVCSYLTNGVELLAKTGQPKKTAWKGSRIPVKACYGKIFYTSDGAGSTERGAPLGNRPRKQIISYIQPGMNPQKYYNYLKSSEGERFKMNLLVPYFAYEGQLSPDQLIALQSSVHTPVPVVLAKPTTEMTGDTVLELPRRELGTLDIQGYEIAAEAARRDISNALGRSSIGDPRRGNARVDSGVGLQELAKTGDQSSYHFVSAYDAMICAIGEDLEELLEFYDDTASDISTRTASGVVKNVRVNDPSATDDMGQPAYLPMDQGTHATTVSTGPSFDSEREEATAFADTLIGNQMIDRLLGPEKATTLLALAIKLKNVGPIGDEMSEIVHPTQGNDPKQMQQQLHQVMGQLQKQSAVLAEMHGIIQQKQIEAKTEMDKAQLEADTKIKVAEIQFASATAVADIKADMAHSLQLMENQFQAIQGLVDAHQAQLDRVQEAQAQLTAQQHSATMQQTPPPVDPNAPPPEPTT